MVLKIYMFVTITLYNLSYILCYDYLSLFEANTNNGKGLCLSDCRDVLDHKKCIYDWNAHETECQPLKQKTKKYRTINNEECISNCGNFEGTSYQWCVNKKNEWDYCNRKIANKGVLSYRTKNRYISCSGNCGKRGSSYNWCYTSGGSWQYCYPDKKILLFNYINEDNNECANPCELYEDHKAYCYDKNNSWRKCYLNPEYKDTLNAYSTIIESSCKSGNYTPNGYRHCSNKVKRDLSFTCPLNVEDIARDYEENNPTVIVRYIDPDNIITLDDNPVHSYTVSPRRNYFGSEPLNLPLVVRAIITNNTLRNPGERESFTTDINNHFYNMKPNLNHVYYDERGHIIGSRLGGPTEKFNIFPQPWIHNRGRFSRWQYMESDLDNFIRNHPLRYAEFTAVLSYRTNVNGLLNFRPTGIALRIRLYDNNVLVDMRGNPITFNTNSLENMYYTNNPDHSCIIEGDEIEDNFN